MKKKLTVILLTLALLAGCKPQAPAAPSTADTPNKEEIIQQSVDEAVQEKLKEYEEEQKEKDQEIAELKKQLEELTTQSTQPEVPPAPAQEETPPASQPEEPLPESESEPELPPQPEPEPAPAQSQPSASPSSSDGFDLKNAYPGFVWEGVEGAEEETYTAGCLLDEAEEVIRLTNQERENHGLEPLAVDEDLMELARVRAEEIREKYSHTRPDGTSVVDLRCGENCGQNTSATKQVDAWMNSEGHRTNILLDRYHHIGVGCYQAENGNLYWVQVFSLD